MNAPAAPAAAQGKAHKPLAPVPLDQWVDATRRLLVRERDEEVALVQQELATLDDAQNPNVLVNLRVMQRATALFGRMLVELAFPSVHVQRPKPHHFTVGDLVQIRLQSHRSSSSSSSSSSASSGSSAQAPKPASASSKSGVAANKLPTGIVARVDETSISIALSENDAIDDDELLASSHAITLDRLVNTATFAKISSALDQLAKFDYGAAQSVVEIVFAGKTPSASPLPAITPFNAGLNGPQLDAIQFALASHDLALIHGPPGTGKTTTVVELIRQVVAVSKLKVLVCAPSNIAVDNVLDKVASADSTLQLLRIGHPARLLPSVVRHCLDAKIHAADGTAIVDDIRSETTRLQRELSKTRDKSARYQLRRELQANRREIRQREQRVVRELVKHSDVVFATNVGAASKLLQDMTFDVVVIDEAAQALEASCWIPILKAKRCVLAGDHRQLPPTIKSKTAARDGLSVTLFDRLTQFRHTQAIVKMLTIQYRMHAAISDWSSHAMYHGALASDDGVARRKLHELPHVAIAHDDDLLNATLLLIDTAGCGLDEDEDESSSAKATATSSPLALSKSNAGEALVVAKHVRALVRAGLKQDEVAVITPYNKQVQALKALLLEPFPQLEIRSVDGFQGCEKEAVVMSLVRSNSAHEVGFLADDRRMNVAITRAKRHVAVVCDSDTIRSHKFLKALVDHFETHGEYRSAQEFIDEDLVHGSADAAAVVLAATEAAPFEPAATRAKASSGAKAAAKTAAVNKKKGKKDEDVAKTETSSAAAVPSQPLASKSPVEGAKDAGAPSLSAAAAETEDETKTRKQSTSGEQAGGSRIDAASDGESEEEGDREEKGHASTATAASASVFQLMTGDSDSSDDSDDDGSNGGNGEGDDRADNAKPASRDQVSTTNALLKDLHLARLARQPPAPPASSTASSKSKKSKKNKKKSNKATVASTVAVSALVDGEDELAFLEREAKSSFKCSFQGASRCKKSTALMGSLCKFCKLMFCYDHGLPEVHGCGDAVRTFERTQYQLQQRQRTAASASASGGAKPLSADKRKLLMKKLNEKVSAKTADRTAKGKETSKK